MNFSSRPRADWLALFALAFVCAIVFWPLLSGQTLYYGDLQLYFQPMATFWKSGIAQGRVPLWNAGILGGAPFVGSPQMWILYPSALLFIPFSAITALTITTVFHFWLAGAFFYGWTRVVMNGFSLFLLDQIAVGRDANAAAGGSCVTQWSAPDALVRQWLRLQEPHGPPCRTSARRA